MTEIEITEGLRNKDNKAFEFIIENYGKTVLKIISSILDKNHERDFIIECYDDVFMKALNNINKHDSSYEIKFWIYAIARNTALDYKRKLTDLYKKMELKEYDNPENNIEVSNYNNDITLEINEIFKGLTINEKILFRDKFIVEYDTDYLTKKYLISEGTLYKRVSRLRDKCKKLRKKLRKERI